MRRQEHAFTLIELLVVVTIIVILLALLAPAMEKAIFQAELATCAANLKGIGTGLSIYATQNKRAYPYRYYASGQDGNSSWWPHMLAAPGVAGDVRLMLGGIIATKSYNDPLCGKIDFDPAATDGSWVYGNYPIWGGFGYVGNGGMRKIGDRFTWQGQAFNLLVSDWDLRWDGVGAEGSHPDADGIMGRVVEQKQGTLGTALNTETISRWFNVVKPDPRRGLVDQNFMYQDGAVRRLSNMKAKLEDDDRQTQVPLESSAANQAVLNLQVPRE